MRPSPMTIFWVPTELSAQKDLVLWGIYPPYPSQIPGPSGVDKIDIRAVTNGYIWATGGATAGYVMDLGPLLSSPKKNSTYYAFWFVRSCYPLLGCSGVKIAVRGR